MTDSLLCRAYRHQLHTVVIPIILYAWWFVLLKKTNLTRQDLVATGRATIHRKIPNNSEEHNFAEVSGWANSYVLHFFGKNIQCRSGSHCDIGDFGCMALIIPSRKLPCPSSNGSNFQLDGPWNYRTVRFITGHLATLSFKHTSSARKVETDSRKCPQVSKWLKPLPARDCQQLYNKQDLNALTRKSWRYCCFLKFLDPVWQNINFFHTFSGKTIWDFTIFF